MDSKNHPSKIISIHGLSKSFWGQSIFNNLNLDVYTHSFSILIAPNGTGKSTLLRIILGLEREDEGVITLHDGLKRKDIAFVAENIEFDPHCSVKKFLKFYATLFPNFKMKWLMECADQRNINLNLNFSKLSRGQKMQILLLSQLARNPKILLVDEITSVLDPYSKEYYLALLHQYQQEGGTILLTTNILTEIEKFGDRIIMLRDGGISLHDKTLTIINDHKKLLMREIDFNKLFQGQTKSNSIKENFVIEKTFFDGQPYYQWLVNLAQFNQLVQQPYFVYFQHSSISMEDIFRFIYKNSMLERKDQTSQEVLLRSKSDLEAA